MIQNSRLQINVTPPLLLPNRTSILRQVQLPVISPPNQPPMKIETLETQISKYLPCHGIQLLLQNLQDSNHG
jgi:hypothetical protein